MENKKQGNLRCPAHSMHKGAISPRRFWLALTIRQMPGFLIPLSDKSRR